LKGNSLQLKLKDLPMTENQSFDVIIIGGSYSGLSAAMALGRSMRKVMVLDGGNPCNKTAPHSHNFITQDGEVPGDISLKAKSQVLRYPSVTFENDIALEVNPTGEAFSVTTENGKNLNAKKIIFATGVRDIMPDIKGFAECWGVTVFQCPYCHGYEIKNERTGILGNGGLALHYAQLIRNWTNDLTIFTNGPSTLESDQLEKMEKHNIRIVEKEIAFLEHENGVVKQIVFSDNASFPLKAIYSKPEFEQHCKIPELLGCEFTEHNHIKVDIFQRTTVPGIFACGDNSSPMRSVANAVSSGNMAGAAVNSLLTEEEF
jgi:thioredoxin reductase